GRALGPSGARRRPAAPPAHGREEVHVDDLQAARSDPRIRIWQDRQREAVRALTCRGRRAYTRPGTDSRLRSTGGLMRRRKVVLAIAAVVAGALAAGAIAAVQAAPPAKSVKFVGAKAGS